MGIFFYSHTLKMLPSLFNLYVTLKTMFEGCSLELPNCVMHWINKYNIYDVVVAPSQQSQLQRIIIIYYCCCSH